MGLLTGAMRRLGSWGDDTRALRTVRGTIRCVESVRSPLDGLPCAIAWTVIQGRGPLRIPRRVAVATAGRILLEGAGGPYAVDPAGLHVRRSGVRPQFPTVLGALPERLASAVLAAGIDGLHPLTFGEGFFHEGDTLTLRGLCRLEPCPWLAGLRDGRILPTLRAYRGRLEIRTPLGLVAPR